MAKQRRGPLMAAALLCILSLAVMATALLLSGREPAFTPPPFDSAALQGTPQVPEELQWGPIDAQVYTASICGVLRPEDGQMDIWLTNPAENNVWLKLRVLDDEGELLGETGLLRPGEYVRSVALTSTPPPGSSVCLKLMAYEPDTYYSAGSVRLHTTVTGG